MDVRMRTIVFELVIIAIIALIGCQGPAVNSANENEAQGKTYVEFALSSPSHLDDWESLYAILKEQGISCIEGYSSLGTYQLSVAAIDFRKAKQVAVKLVQQNSMTIRLKQNIKGDIFEVYTKGKKTAEESYVIEAIDTVERKDDIWDTLASVRGTKTDPVFAYYFTPVDKEEYDIKLSTVSKLGYKLLNTGKMKDGNLVVDFFYVEGRNVKELLPNDKGYGPFDEFGYQLGEAQAPYFDFPEGIQSLQLEKSTKIYIKDLGIIVFENEEEPFGVVDTVISAPQLQATKSSYYNLRNTKTTFFFLAHASKNSLEIEDGDTSLLSFMKYKFEIENSEVEIKKGMVDHSYAAYYRIIWKKEQPVYLVKGSKSYKTNIATWECKTYQAPEAILNPLGLGKLRDDGVTEDMSEHYENPYFIFGSLSFYNLEPEWNRKDNLSVDTITLNDVNNTAIAGYAIDLDQDGIYDVFWHNKLLCTSPIELLSLLYINIDGRWVQRRRNLSFHI